MLARLLMLIFMVFMIAIPANAASFRDRAANMGQITNMRTNTSSERTRIVLDVTKEVDYEVKVMSNPRRIVVDLYGAWIGSNVTKSRSIDSRFADKVRIAQFNENTVRVVVETNIGDNNFDVFSLEGGTVPYRIVLDFGYLNAGSSNNVTIDFTGAGKAQLEKEKAEKERLEQEKKERLEKEQQASEDNSYEDNSYDDNSYSSNIDISQKIHEVGLDFSDIDALSGRVICLDAGHGGNDPGAIGPTGITEKSVTLRVATLVEDLLTAAGAEVIMTRERDVEVARRGKNASDSEELQARCDVANAEEAEIFISMHMDAAGSSSANGTTGYYYEKGSESSKRLATDIEEGMLEELGTVDRGIKPCRFYVVKNTDMPATLVEMAFISNPREEKLMNSDEGINKAAAGIVKGINRYFNGD